ncbi:hypothetical protein ACFWUQ_05675 [Streptomyces sp. NPDC058662]|uniref:hypothetical protein n=1 Tax=Streptomyces sp. NPDC058662 TaxID=3346583 RepID=UPI0036588637
MPAPTGPLRSLPVAVLGAALLAGLTGCAETPGATPAAPSAPPSAQASVSASASLAASATASASAAPSAPVSPSAGASVTGAAPPPSPRVASSPPAPTRLTVAVQTRGGRLALVRGGPAQEFTVTLRNGNSVDHRHVLVAFQMEPLIGDAGDPPAGGPGFQLERFDPVSGTWRPTALRLAADAKPAALFTGGGPLGRDAVRVERYRLRAGAGGPTGSSPLMVSFLDTDAHREAAPHVAVPHTSTR